MDHQPEILRLACDFDQDGRLPYDTIIYSCVKKSAKTTVNAALRRAGKRHPEENARRHVLIAVSIAP
jgi:hypothetical protein